MKRWRKRKPRQSVKMEESHQRSGVVHAILGMKETVQKEAKIAGREVAVYFFADNLVPWVCKGL